MVNISVTKVVIVFTNRLQIQKGVCNLLILNINQIEHCFPKGQVIGSNPIGVTKTANKYRALRQLPQCTLQDHAGFCSLCTRTCKEHRYKTRSDMPAK